jgi:DNA-binding FadR family transcriptional regulator
VSTSDPLLNVTPVTSRSAAAHIADQIVLAVREGRLGPGDRLPPERELAGRFHVSRPTMREALTALELAGVLESQQGKGTAIVGTAAQVAMWGIEVLPHEIFEARLAIEPQLARLAAAKHHPEDLAALHEALGALDAEYAATGSYQDDFPVHRGIARAAHNPILERALEDALIHTHNQRWIDLSQRVYGTLETRKARHDDAHRVVHHIEHGDGTAAAKVWRQHITVFRDHMLGRDDEATHH